MSNAIKVLSATPEAYRIGGYGVVFGGRDLDGETFQPDTDYNLELVPRKPVYYDHAQRDIKSPLGNVDELRHDDAGIWIEAELSRSHSYIDRVMTLVHAGKLGWSSGSVEHLTQRAGGVIKSWPIVEFSLTPTPAEPRTLGVTELKSLFEDMPEFAAMLNELPAQDTQDPSGARELLEMEQEVKTAEPVQAPPANDAVLDAIKALGGQIAGMKDELEAVKAEVKAESKKAINDPGIAAPNVVADVSHWKYDDYDHGQLGWAIAILENGKRSGQSKRGASPAMYKALAMRLEGEEAQKTESGRAANRAFKSTGMKTNELNQSTLASYGDEWVGLAYSGSLWEKIRAETQIVSRIPSFEFPAGAESLVIPLESGDPTWYKVAQAASLTSDPGGIVSNTVTSSKLGTAQTTMTLAKMGARVLYTGEMEEDAFVPYVANLQRQLVLSAAEYLEHVVIDGDTDTTASTNINDIAGTPAGSEAFLLVNGFRKVPIITLSANSRDGGTLDVEDYLETVKLMGTGGIAGYDQSRVAFIIDRMTHYKTLTLQDVRSRDVFNGATIEGGRISSIWGYPVYMSGHMAKLTNGLTNTAGKSDLDTAGNNTKGQILAVRWDRWQFGWRRRMTIETTRIPAADATEIVSLMRFGLTYSATDDAAALTYNLTV